jgi:integrase
MTKSTTRADRVVRSTRRDGTVVEYHYAAWKAPAAPVVAEAEAPGSDTVGALLAAYELSPNWQNMKENSRRARARALRHLNGMERTPLSAVTRKILIGIRNAIGTSSGQGAAGEFAAAVTALFNFAQKEDHVQYSVAKDMDDGLKHGEFPAWSNAEADLAEKHLTERLRRAVVLGRYTAQRRGDLVKMAWQDIHTDAQGFEWIRVVQEKTGIELEVPVLPALSKELAAWRAEVNVIDQRGMPQGTILNTDAGIPWKGNNLSVQINKHVAKIPGFPKGRNIHGLRKLALATLASKGGTAHELMAYGGHQTLAMVQHYTKSADRLANAQAARAKLTA